MQAQATDQETGKEVGQVPGFERMVKWLTENMVEDENTVSISYDIQYSMYA